MKKLLRNASIIDFENNRFKVVNIILNDSKIEKIIEKNSILDEVFEDKNIISCENCLVLSGFINSQSYLLKNFYYNNFVESNLDSFEDSFENFKNKLTNEDKFYIYKFQLLNAIKNGITTICDYDLFNLSLKKAVLESQINCVYKIGINNSQDKIDENLVKKLELQKENYIFSLNNVLFNSENNFNSIIKLSRKYNKPILCNGSENLFLAGEIEKEFNSSNVKLLENYGLLDNNHILNNSNVLDKEDYQILNNYNTKLIFSQSLNLNLGFKNANIYALSKQNLVGLSSFNNDYNLELFLARNLEKDSYDTMQVFSEKNLFDFCTKNNAEILGLKNTGEIKEGNLANLIILNDISLLSVNSLLKNFDNRNIKSVIIKGNLIYNNQHFIENKDYNKLESICNNIILKFKK